KHNRLIVYTVNSSLLAVDLAFFASTCTKFVDGGWFPVLIALALAFIMLTWRKGEEMMDKIRLEVRLRSKDLLERLKADPPLRIPGTAVVLGRMTTGVPLSLTQNLKHNHVLHEKVLLVAVTITETPRVADEERVVVTPISDEFTRAELRFGFMEQPDVHKGKHNRLIVYTVNSSLLAVDLAFFASTCTKFVDGGWFPVLIALALAFIMLTWRKGEEMMDKIRLEVRLRSKDLLERLK